jgi:hypothetical protein
VEADCAAAIDPDDGEPWNPLQPGDFEDRTEEELAGASEKLDTMVQQLQSNSDFFFTPANFGALPELWLQAAVYANESAAIPY